MPIFGEPDFESAVQKVMKDSDVSRDSAEKIVGAAEAKKKGKLASAKLKIMIMKVGNIRNPEEYELRTPKKKDKKKMNIHLLMNTPLEGKLNDIKVRILKMKAKLLKAQLSSQDEVMLTRLMKTLEGDKIADKRDELTSRLLLRQEVADNLAQEPENDVYKKELEMKDQDVTFIIDDLLKTDKRYRGGIPIDPGFMGKLTAKLLTAFDESKINRDESGEFAEKGGEGGGKGKDKSAERFKFGEKTQDRFDSMTLDEKIDLMVDAGGFDRDEAQDLAEASFFKDLDPQDQEEIAKIFKEQDETTTKKADRDTLQENLFKIEPSNPSDSQLNDNFHLLEDEEKRELMDQIADEFDMSDKGYPNTDSHLDDFREHFTEGSGENRKSSEEQFNELIDNRIPDIYDLNARDKLTKKTSEKIERFTKQVKDRKKDVKEAGKLFRKLENGSEFEQNQASQISSNTSSNLQRAESNLAEHTKIRDNFNKINKDLMRQIKKSGKSKTGKLRTGSLVDEYHTASGDRYVTYFLLNDQTNLKGWGVTAKSIPQNIGTFKNMPFVITKTKFFPRSAYGEITDHPSTEHFQKLGIKIGRDRPRQKNDMMQQASFQEEFRVGNIDEIVRSTNGDWMAFIKIKQQFADYEMPPLVSPAIFQLNPMEPMENISTWVGMHLAGLDESPAYGNDALYKGSCFGDKNTCMTQLSAKLPTMMAYLPPCAMKKMYSARMKVAEMKIAVMISTDPGRAETQRLDILCKKDGELSACPQNTTKKKKTFGMRERTAGGPGSGPRSHAEKRGQEIKVERKAESLKKRMKGERKKFLKNHPEKTK